MTELEEMAIRHGTDKQSAGGHCYARHYEHHFAPFRNREINLFEIGVSGYEDPMKGGESLRLWKEYFPNARIAALDFFDKSGLTEDRVEIFRGTQDSKETLDQIVQQYGEFDIIIGCSTWRWVPVRALRALLPGRE